MPTAMPKVSRQGGGALEFIEVPFPLDRVGETYTSIAESGQSPVKVLQW